MDKAYFDMIRLMEDPKVSGKMTWESAEGAKGLSGFTFKLTPAMAQGTNPLAHPDYKGGAVPSDAEPPEKSRTPIGLKALPQAPVPEEYPKFRMNPSMGYAADPGLAPPASTGMSAIDQQGMYGTLAQILAGFGSGFLDKDNPMQAIGATAAGVGRNLAYNAALKKQLAAILGEGGNSNF